MSTIYVCSAFSPAMLSREEQAKPGYGPRILRPVDEPREWLDATIAAYEHHPEAVVAGRLIEHRGMEIVSAIGHADVARIISEQLGRELSMARLTVRLQPGDIALIGQYVGPRLPEGCTTLPEGARIEWWVV